MLSAELKAEADNTHRDLDYLGYYKTEFHNYFIIHCFEENDDNHTRRKEPELILLVEIMHCARNLQISQLSTSR